MTKDEAIRRAEIAMAWARGETVQWRGRSLEGSWNHCPSAENNYRPNFFDPDCEWRIKPKPLECWVWVPDDSVSTSVAYYSQERPPLPFYDYYEPGRWVRMREVEE